jgi:hypothetical protein
VISAVQQTFALLRLAFAVGSAHAGGRMLLCPVGV